MLSSPNDGPVKKLSQAQVILAVGLGIFCAVMMAFFFYYPQTRQHKHTYFDTPEHQGALVSERFKTWDFWKTALFVLVFPYLLFGGYVLVFWQARWIHIVFLIYLALTLLGLLGIVGWDIFLVLTKNDPNNPQNPANSYAVCCIPEFYTAVPSCPNYGKNVTECFPPKVLSDLGANRDFWFAFGFECAFAAFNIGLIILTVIVYNAAENFEKKGDENWIQVELVETGQKIWVQKELDPLKPAYGKPAIPIKGSLIGSVVHRGNGKKE